MSLATGKIQRTSTKHNPLEGPGSHVVSYDTGDITDGIPWHPVVFLGHLQELPGETLALLRF